MDYQQLSKEKQLQKGLQLIKDMNITYSFSEFIEMIKHDIKDIYYDFIMKNKKEIDEICKDDLPTLPSSFLSLKSSYLIKNLDGVIEKPAFMSMREAIQESGLNIEKVKRNYKILSGGFVSSPSPIKYNSCLKKNSLASCYLLSVQDNKKNIVEHLNNNVCHITSNSGGIGIDFEDIRVSKLENGKIPTGPMGYIRVTGENLNAWSANRAGNSVVQLPIWHLSVGELIKMREPKVGRDIYPKGLWPLIWINDLFFKRVLKDQNWTLFCPNEASALKGKIGEEFETEYIKLESNDKVQKKVVRAKQLLFDIAYAKKTTGSVYIMSSEAGFMCANQKNQGKLSTNLCNEIIQTTQDDNVSMCNLSSINIEAHVIDDKFDYKTLRDTCRATVDNLINCILEGNYINEKMKALNLANKPLGIGIIGLADAIAKMDMIYESEETIQFVKVMIAAIYYFTLQRRVELAKKYGPYKYFEGSPMSKGEFSFDLMKKRRDILPIKIYKDEDYELIDPKIFGGDQSWKELRSDMMKYGVIGSDGLSIAPTEASSLLMGLNPSFEPFESNMFIRIVNKGEHLMINHYLIEDLKKIKSWNPLTIQFLRKNKGSVKGLSEFLEKPEAKRLELKYKKASEIDDKFLTRLVSVLQNSVEQSISFSYFKDYPQEEDLMNMIIYRWLMGLKNVNYYTKLKPSTEMIDMSNIICESCTV